MTQIWQGDQVIGVTPVLAGPCLVTQIKNEDADGYQALQLGFGDRQEKNISKPVKGHLAKAGKINVKYLREFRGVDIKDIAVGDLITADTFSVGDAINVTGISKGKGFQGVIKRHGFHGFRKTHGNKDQERHSGSVGAKGPARVFKGTRMGGHMGDERITTTNLEVIDLDLDKNIIYVKGAVPGAINSLVMIEGQGDLKITKSTTEKAKVENEETKTEAVAEGKTEEVKIEVKTETAAIEVEEKIAEKNEEAKTETAADEVKVEEAKEEAKASEETKEETKASEETKAEEAEKE